MSAALKLAKIETWHFWFVGRRRLIDRLFARYWGKRPAKVLDVGCGTGQTVRNFAERGHYTVGLDIEMDGLRFSRRSFASAPVLQADALRLPFVSNAFDVVLLLDVLEHVNDQTAVREVYRVLKPGGLLFAAVPAMPWLWSYRDEAAGHRRRYTRPEFKRLLTAVGFSICEIRYYQCLLFPLVVISRWWGRRSTRIRDWEEKRLPLLNTVLVWITYLEVALGDTLRWPWGVIPDGHRSERVSGCETLH